MFETVDTPAVLIDQEIAERNIQRYQAYCDKHGIALRPHIKTHKTREFARQQVMAGAMGITCQKISEAQVMADAGLDDILITYNILGSDKLKRLRALADRTKLSVTADNRFVVEGLSRTFAAAPKPLTVLVECDSGARRCGVTTPAEAMELAQIIVEAAGLSFGGLMTYPAVGGTEKVETWMREALALCADAGIDCGTVSSGGSPDMWSAHLAPVVTEYRVGTYIYNDRSLVAGGVCRWQDCALTVLATVVSTPAPDRAVIDAGSKILTSDLLGLKGHGHVLGRDDLSILSLSEEHGCVTSSEGATRLTVGDRVRIVPNHCCVVSNMMDRVNLHRGDNLEGPRKVAARGCVI
ncbi:D-TA family PLP-dependent enzyme [Pelagibius sp. Alg239-R121]|uniref:D-TA family PLP-dependent enzyme n=1 Tax=Pelagibius sp. Alg239-R121 TaxID=2993448 RepID=UPI0024A763BE|nr:D-TA family PLP-dependent enzyme [Pelagibius sp. Alg239-R121]